MTDGWTDKQTCRDARPHLKKVAEVCFIQKQEFVIFSLKLRGLQAEYSSDVLSDTQWQLAMEMAERIADEVDEDNEEEDDDGKEEGEEEEKKEEEKEEEKQKLKGDEAQEEVVKNDAMAKIADSNTDLFMIEDHESDDEDIQSKFSVVNTVKPRYSASAYNIISLIKHTIFGPKKCFHRYSETPL